MFQKLCSCNFQHFFCLLWRSSRPFFSKHVRKEFYGQFVLMRLVLRPIEYFEVHKVLVNNFSKVFKWENFHEKENIFLHTLSFRLRGLSVSNFEATMHIRSFKLEKGNFSTSNELNIVTLLEKKSFAQFQDTELQLNRSNSEKCVLSDFEQIGSCCLVYKIFLQQPQNDVCQDSKVETRVFTKVSLCNIA